MHYIEQTTNWANFRKAAKGEEYFEKENVFIQKMPLPFGKCWLYINRGPIINLDDLAKTENAVYARFEHPYQKSQNHKFNKNLHNAHAHYQPEVTLMIDLKQSEDEILSQMKQKGRYNIKLAKKKGVKISESNDASEFYKILKQTWQRDKFKGHNKEYYQKMLDMLDEAKLYYAEYEGEIIAGIIVTFYKDTATYYYGASSNKHRNVMAPYLLQWHAIRRARSKGCKYYDLLGIAPEGAKNHPWQGVSAFKRKFGGKIIEYEHAKERIYRPFWYWLMRLVKKLRP
jgi:lipid II:glycine glycyltransferase (peptidoglycan interpeptide bridge formation enzyme)